jgi:hypothetical protein
MICIAITQAAFDVIVATLPVGSVAYESELNAKGEHVVWLDVAALNRLTAMRQQGESYSDVILRMAAAEGGKR